MHLSLACGIALYSSSQAADGNWNTSSGGSWSLPANWVGGTVADGPGVTADFSTLDIVGTPSVILDSARTVGHIRFADSNSETTGSWNLGAASETDLLNLATISGSPSIFVDGSTAATVGARIIGTSGLTKTGSGLLTLTGVNSYTGTTTISGGTLKLSGAGTLGSMTDIDMRNANVVLDLGGTIQAAGAIHTGWGSIINGSITATSYLMDGGVHSANLGGAGANLVTEPSSITYLSGNNTYTGTTTIGHHGTLQILSPSSLYGGDTSKWTSSNITTMNQGGIVVRLGGSNGFTMSQAMGLFQNLTTSISDNGLSAGSAFGFDTSGASSPIAFNHSIGDSSGSGGGKLDFSVEGSQVLVLNQLNSYSGDTRLYGGKIQIGHANAIPSGAGKGGITTQMWTAGQSSIDLNGHNISINFLAGDGATIMNNAAGTARTFSIGSNDPSQSDSWFAGIIADNDGTGGTLSLDKVGTTTQILDGLNIYTGATTVRGGTLVVNGSISTSVETIVKDLATIAGNGLLGVLTIESGGRVSPGTSTGILRTGDLTVQGTFAAEINGNTVGTLYDQLEVSGTVTLSGLLNISMTGYTPTDGNLFFLISNDDSDPVSGLFTGLSEGDEFNMSGQRWKISYLADFENQVFNGGNDVALMAIPEPGSIFLVTLGVIPVLRRNRRHFSSKSGSL